MNVVFHGSKTQGLKKLYRRSRTHQEEWVYATPSKAVATIFISNGGSDFNYNLSGRGTDESPIILVERKAGMFDEIFNLSGSLYTLKGDNFQSKKTGWRAEVVSEFDEDIIAEEHIDNVLQKINELAEQGEFKLYRFPDRPDFIHSSIYHCLSFLSLIFSIKARLYPHGTFATACCKSSSSLYSS